MSDIEKINKYLKNTTCLSDYFEIMSSYVMVTEDNKSIYIYSERLNGLATEMFIALKYILGIKKSIKLLCPADEREFESVGGKLCDETLRIMKGNHTDIYKVYYEFDDDIMKSPSILHHIASLCVDYLCDPDLLNRFLHDANVGESVEDKVILCKSFIKNYIIRDVRCKGVVECKMYI